MKIRSVGYTAKHHDKKEVPVMSENKATATRRGFVLNEFVASCSTCMGKEGLLNNVAEAAETTATDTRTE